MRTTIPARTTTARVATTRARGGTKSLPPPRRLTGTQLRELESELRRELAVLERRVINERADESARTSQFAIHDAAVANRRPSDTLVSREAVTDALARLGAKTYGTCARCAAPIPFGRLLAMPEVTHCLSCNGTP
jgi:RNA polymerase-binding transcription factor DksA